MSDPIDQFLETDFSGSAAPPWQRDVLAASLTVLRRRRRWRRLAWSGALAACFLAGMLTMHLWRTAAPEVQQPVAISAPPPADPSPFPEPVPAAPTVTDMEWQAFDSRDNRTALFFQVGHRYFKEQHDFVSALRCYSQALDAAPAEDLAIRPDDNWLVMALKEARHKEKNDATANP